MKLKINLLGQQMHTGLNYGLIDLLSFGGNPEWKGNAQGRTSLFILSSSGLVWKPPNPGGSHIAYKLAVGLRVVEGSGVGT